MNLCGENILRPGLVSILSLSKYVFLLNSALYLIMLGVHGAFFSNSPSTVGFKAPLVTIV